MDGGSKSDTISLRRRGKEGKIEKYFVPLERLLLFPILPSIRTVQIAFKSLFPIARRNRRYTDEIRPMKNPSSSLFYRFLLVALFFASSFDVDKLHRR